MKDLSRPLLATLAVLAIMTAGLTMVIPADDSSATVTSGTAGPTATWSFDDVTKVMTVSGTGDMNDFSTTNNLGTGRAINSVVINEGITNIGHFAFFNCTSLTSIMLPSTLTSIGNSALQGCNALASITLPSTLTSIGNNAFLSCSALTSITIPDSVTYIGTQAFRLCTSVTSINIPVGITHISDYAFQSMSLTSITIPDGVTSIGKYAFQDNLGLTSIIIPSSVTSINNDAFRNCKNLITAYIPNYDSITFGTFVFEHTTNIIKSYPSISITSNQSDVSIITGGDFTYDVIIDPADATISFTGAPWLTVTGNTISGTAGTPGNYNITVSASKTQHNTATQTFTITVVPDLEITSTQSDVSIITGTNFSYNVVTNYADATISVSGASWLNVNGHLIYGTVSEPGEYTITVSAYKDGYSVGSQSFTVTAVSGLVFISGPSAGYIVQAGGQ